MIDWQEHRAVVQGGGAFTIKPASVASGQWRRWMWNQRLWYVTGGRARFRLRGGVTELHPDTAMWLQPGFEYRFESPLEAPLVIY
ncbi:MAG: cupin domain-containing protein [Phycisphaeraceae bacterium]